MLALTGLRASEVAGLVWGDVDLVDGLLNVRKQLAPSSAGVGPRRVKLKSRASQRVVPLVDRAQDALLDQLQSEQAAGRGADTDYVFCTRSGRPLDRTRISERGVARAAEKAGLGRVTAQVLRRSVATATAHAHVPVVVAAALTGHSAEVYNRHYARPFRDAEEREMVRDALASIGFGQRS